MPSEYYQVRVEGNKVLWRGMELTHVKDLPPEERDNILAEVRRLKEQGLGRKRIQKEIARSHSVYVSEDIIRRADAGKEIDWKRCGIRGGYEDLGTREVVYKRVRELYNEGKSYREIQEAVQKEFGVRLSKSHISYWCRDVHKPGGSVKEITLTSDYWWLIGLLIADGNTNVRHIDNYCERRIKLEVNDRVLIEKVAKLTGHSIMMDKRDKGLYVLIHNRELFDLFQRVRQLIEERKFEELLEVMGEDGARAFIRGFFDGDGSGLFVNFSNNDLNILEFIRYALKRVCGIETSEPVLSTMKGAMNYCVSNNRWIVSRRDVYVVFVYPEHYQRFFELVGTTLERKVKLWRLSKKTLKCYSTRFGRTYLEEVQRRFENGEDWTEVLMPLRIAIGRNMRIKQRKTPTPYFSPFSSLTITWFWRPWARI